MQKTTSTKKERIRCIAIDRHREQCRSYRLDEPEHTKFCKNHQYMNDYTDEMLAACVLCSGCKKMFFRPPDSHLSRCDNCSQRSAVNRQKTSEKKKEIDRCAAKGGCNYKRSEENIYCGKHQLHAFEDECAAQNMRPCYEYIRGCRTKLPPDYTYSSCQECLQSKREKDRTARQSVDSYLVVDNHKQCSTCLKMRPLVEYVCQRLPEGQLTKTCLACRESFKLQDSRRDKAHVNELARENSKKPERIEVKNAWKENNYDKVAMTWKTYRAKQIKENQEEYLRRQADTMRQWRENNPDKVNKINERARNSISYSYEDYKQKCGRMRQEFKLSFEEFEAVVRAKCFYCGFCHERGFNGIDRVDSTKGYELINVVNCCSMCNYMKSALDIKTFIKRIIHILSYKEDDVISIDERQLFPEVFMDYSRSHKSSYVSYMNCVQKDRNIDFNLTEDEFYQLTGTPYNPIMEHNYGCYICGKLNSETHRNGIDRFNNDICYTFENSRTCCGNCNFLKKNYDYDALFDKLRSIYRHLTNEGILQEILNLPEGSYGPTITNAQASTSDKMDKFELQEISNRRREESRKRQYDKYSDPEFIRRSAEEIAKKRLEKRSTQKSEEDK